MATFKNDGATGDGVIGTTTSHDANGVIGRNSDATPRNADKPSGHGVFGATQVPDGAGVFGIHQGMGVGAGGVGLIGVWGGSFNGVGVVGISAPPGAKGGDGVQGITNSEIRNGVYGRNDATTTRGSNTAGNGVLGYTRVPDGAGVLGVNGAGGIGVQGASTGHAIMGKGQFGVTGIGSSSGVWGIAQGSGWAGLFNGPMLVTDTAIFQRDVTVDGNVVVTGDIVFTNAADCAEDFDVVEEKLAEPGTVMVVGADGRLEPCTHAYDKRVIGVISGAASYRPAIVLDKHPELTGRRPIALIGKVFCKVDAGHGALEVGDLLTTSPTEGHAMRADSAALAFGAVIGKAMQALDEGCGLVAVLVARQ